MISSRDVFHLEGQKIYLELDACANYIVSLSRCTHCLSLPCCVFQKANRTKHIKRNLFPSSLKLDLASR